MTIDASARKTILDHARRSADIECCGILIGTADHISQAIPANNVLASPTAFSLDPADHFAARRYARAAGLTVVGFYHSHPRSAARPSRRDVEEATDDEAVYLIAGVEDGAAVLRGFRIVRGAVTEEVLT